MTEFHARFAPLTSPKITHSFRTAIIHRRLVTIHDTTFTKVFVPLFYLKRFLLSGPIPQGRWVHFTERESSSHI